MFRDKSIWVFGASSGIGKETAIQLAKKGAKLVLSARSTDALQELKSSLSNGKEHLVVSFDLEHTENVKKTVEDVINEVGKIDMVFHIGGLSQRANAFDTTNEVDRKIMEINYFGNIAVTKALLPHFRENKSGSFVVVSSIAGKFGFFLRSAYSASKHALHGFYESLRLEEEQYGIEVTLVCPGKINTPISTNALTENGERHGVMDHNQETGMPVEVCVEQMLKAVESRKREVFIGGKELNAIHLKRWFPRLFYRILRKQSAT